MMGMLFKRGLIVIGIAATWVVTFDLNAWLFDQIAYSDRAHWIFLPASLRVLAVLLFRGSGAIGLMLGAYLTLPHSQSSDLPLELLLSISSGLAPLIAVAVCQMAFSIDRNLVGLRGSHILALSVASAFANSVLLNALMLAAGRHDGDLILAVTIFVGDTLGAAILLLVIALCVSFISRPRRSRS